MRYLYFIIIITIATFSCKTEKKAKPNPNIPPKYAISKEPKFKNQGNLFFVSQTDTLAKIDIEVADNKKKREQGLMHRKSMKKEQGMLFIFNGEKRRSFFMKQTHIPLDIVFVNNEKTIIHIAENCPPYSLEPIASFEYARYVVEVNAVFCHEHNITVGAEINFTLTATN